jgi:hypothetical protein
VFHLLNAGTRHVAGKLPARGGVNNARRAGRAPVESDPTRVCELLVGLPAVNVLGVDDEPDVEGLLLARRGEGALRLDAPGR